MASARRSCRNNPDVFCYICGQYTLSGDRKNITGFVKRAYGAYFKVKLGDQDKSWAPHTVCKTCVEYLRRWTKGAKTSLKFGIPMVWREPFDHASDCYFCAINTNGIKTRKNRHSLQYPALSHLPAVHWLTAKEIPVPAFTELPDSDDEATSTDERGYTEKEYEAQDSPQPFSQCELNDRVSGSQLVEDFLRAVGLQTQREKYYLARTRVSLSFVEGMRPTWATSARRKTSCTAEMSPVFLLNSALLNTIREIGDSSLTAVSAL
ncbi:hypothetical protein GWK47_011114 [Chionoecetes opilio]|uniref:Uncharacterized protein n=1 Tax=Chionoecetes opilio TaxID=41210 RepID=A0A8J5CMM7_CHIOP|nr:hypothetical protein GWK47_011114 [Chionoecetes opilio]